jgi:hypothetical protein
MSLRDRQKASDVFGNAEFLFARKVSFSDAFPAIEDLKVVVEHLGYCGVHEWNRVRRYSSKEVGEFVDCTNPLCYNGGFSVGSLIRGMIPEKKTHLEATESCQGYEGSPKGRRRYRDCTNVFKVTIDIKYKP